MVKITVLLCSLVILLSCSSDLHSQATPNTSCDINITAPSNGSVVTDNGDLSHINLFSFSVEGTVSKLDSNSICIYQKVPGGHEWWRSGEPIKQDDLGTDGKWSMSFASCGSSASPHGACILKAVVQSQCPASGSTTIEINNIICGSPSFTYRTR